MIAGTARGERGQVIVVAGDDGDDDQKREYVGARKGGVRTFKQFVVSIWIQAVAILSSIHWLVFHRSS